MILEYLATPSRTTLRSQCNLSGTLWSKFRHFVPLHCSKGTGNSETVYQERVCEMNLCDGRTVRPKRVQSEHDLENQKYHEHERN